MAKKVAIRLYRAVASLLLESGDKLLLESGSIDATAGVSTAIKHAGQVALLAGGGVWKGFGALEA